MKLQWNKYIVPPHTIYSRPNKLQSQRMLPSNSLFSWKLCWNLICIQKKKKDEISKNIYSPRYVVLTHTPLHMSSLANTCRHILACPTLLKWCGGCFLLDLAQKTTDLCFGNDESMQHPPPFEDCQEVAPSQVSAEQHTAAKIRVIQCEMFAKRTYNLFGTSRCKSVELDSYMGSQGEI